MARLLVVDDDRDQIKLWRLMLERSGHQIETAETLARALELMPVFDPDVLVMDLRLPELADGQALIRKAGERAAMKVVVFSGWPQDLESLPERKLVHRILLKPVTLPTLLRTIGELTTRGAGG